MYVQVGFPPPPVRSMLYSLANTSSCSVFSATGSWLTNPVAGMAYGPDGRAWHNLPKNRRTTVACRAPHRKGCAGGWADWRGRFGQKGGNDAGGALDKMNTRLPPQYNAPPVDAAATRRLLADKRTTDFTGKTHTC